jgi:XTP/dITP diphosphohydrolase
MVWFLYVHLPEIDSFENKMTQEKIRIILATRNAHKFSEIKDILRELPIELTDLTAYPHIPEIDETGSTFVENAVLKAKTVFEYNQTWSIADDSGLEVFALDGSPGIFSARFAGEEHNYRENNQKLLKLLSNVPPQKRNAQFRCVAAIIGPDYKEIMEGIVHGKITSELRGDKGFGYDPLFIPEGYDKTFAELGEKVKNQISHRALAFEKVKEVLKNIIFMPSF